MDYSKVTWILDKYMESREHATGHPTLAEALTEIGCQVVWSSRDMIRLTPADLWQLEPGCVVSYGSHKFVKELSAVSRGRWVPLAYSRTDPLAYSESSPHIGHLMLNRDYVLLPLAEARRRGTEMFGGEGYFLKPNSLIKSFTGLVITPENEAIEFETIRQKSTAEDGTICVLSGLQDILAEFRFVIADKKVVTGSQYSWDKCIDVRTDVLPACQAVATQVAGLEWQPDAVYTCDVAMTRAGRAAVIELNTFSSAGLYACDTTAIAHAVSQAAWREFKGED